MAEKILKSPGVSAREIDLSQPGTVAIQGTPAVVIGTSAKGPAFDRQPGNPGGNDRLAQPTGCSAILKPPLRTITTHDSIFC